MEKALAIRQLINNLRDLAPVSTEWPGTLPLLRDSARQLGFPCRAAYTQQPHVIKQAQQMIINPRTTLGHTFRSGLNVDC